MAEIEDQSVDLILCDLPYGTTQNKWDIHIPLYLLWEHYKRMLKDKGAVVLFAQTPFDKILGYSNLKHLKYEWVWVKTTATGHLNAKKTPLKNHENLLVFYSNTPTYNPQMTPGKPYRMSSGRGSTNYGSQESVVCDNEGFRYPKSVLEFKTDRGLHPTQKPVALLEYLIKTYTNEADLVLDNCMGSGSCGVAAINTKRSFIGIEKDEKYFNIAKERIEKISTLPD